MRLSALSAHSSTGEWPQQLLPMRSSYTCLTRYSFKKGFMRSVTLVQILPDHPDLSLVFAECPSQWYVTAFSLQCFYVQNLTDLQQPQLPLPEQRHQTNHLKEESMDKPPMEGVRSINICSKPGTSTGRGSGPTYTRQRRSKEQRGQVMYARICWLIRTAQLVTSY